jgi:hypothetical protein
MALLFYILISVPPLQNSFFPYPPQVSQNPLTPTEAEFLKAAIENPLTRIPLQPWVIEPMHGTLENRKRHRFHRIPLLGSITSVPTVKQLDRADFTG